MILIENVAVATVDAAGTEYADGHVVIGDDGRIVAVGAGHAGRYHGPSGASTAPAAWSRPGLVNTHHHLYQWATRGLALDETLFGWLTTLYPIWGRLDAEIVGAAAAAGLGWLALSGCTTAHGPPLRLPARRRRRAGRGDRGGAADRAAVPPDPRLDGPGPRRTAGCRRTTSSRTPTRRWPPPRRRSTAGTTRRRTRCCRSRWRPARRSRSPRS